MKGVNFSAKEKERALKMWVVEHENWQNVCKKNKCTRVSLWRWKNRYDGTLLSLENKSSRPHSHPAQQTESEREEIIKIRNENPTMGYTELFGELRLKFAYSRHYMTMYKFIRKNCFVDTKIYNAYVPKPYDTPEMLGAKMQMDVKYVPRNCFFGKAKQRFEEAGAKLYQYTIIDETTRERFLYAYREQSARATRDFIMRAITYFGYVPKIIQTDNGGEFTNPRGASCKKAHIVDEVLQELKIVHQLIRPYTPRHNGKVERSHRTDQEKFYNFLTFETFEELKEKMKNWQIRYNKTPSTILRDKYGKKRFQSPLEKRAELLEVLKENDNIESVRFLKNNSCIG